MRTWPASENIFLYCASPFFLWRGEMIRCLCSEITWDGWHSVRLPLTIWGSRRRTIIYFRTTVVHGYLKPQEVKPRTRRDCCKHGVQQQETKRSYIKGEAIFNFEGSVSLVEEFQVKDGEWKKDLCVFIHLLLHSFKRQPQSLSAAGPVLRAVMWRWGRRWECQGGPPCRYTGGLGCLLLRGQE